VCVFVQILWCVCAWVYVNAHARTRVHMCVGCVIVHCNTYWQHKYKNDGHSSTDTLQDTTAHCTETHCNLLVAQIQKRWSSYQRTLHNIATNRNTLQHTASHRNLLVAPIQHQNTATNWSTLQHTATHYSTLQHTTAHCSTLQPVGSTNTNHIFPSAHTVHLRENLVNNPIPRLWRPTARPTRLGYRVNLIKEEDTRRCPARLLPANEKKSTFSKISSQVNWQDIKTWQDMMTMELTDENVWNFGVQTVCSFAEKSWIILSKSPI